MNLVHWIDIAGLLFIVVALVVDGKSDPTRANVIMGWFCAFFWCLNATISHFIAK